MTVVHRHERFTVSQRIVAEPERDALLIELTLTGDPQLGLYVLLAPHLGGTGRGNRAAVGSHHGRRVLWAEQGPFGLALAAVDARQADAMGPASAGYSGSSDGWQDFARHGRMTWHYRRAGPGNVALMAALPRHCALALGFAGSWQAAATLAIAALSQPFAAVWSTQIAQWRAWHAGCRLPAGVDRLPAEVQAQLRTSAMVLKTHGDRTFAGAMVASLSVPWGEVAQERPGYHLVWPRDLVENAGALLALGAESEARNILRYLIATQRADGSWFQNQWLGGAPYWQGVQLDEVAFPVLLAGTLADREALDGIEVGDMVRRALGFIVRHGPASPQDRWEENSGVNAFTMTVCLAALVSGRVSCRRRRRLRPGTGRLLERPPRRLDQRRWLGARSPARRAWPLPAHRAGRGAQDVAALARVQPIKNREQDLWPAGHRSRSAVTSCNWCATACAIPTCR